MRVIIVDDDKLVSLSLKTIIEAKGGFEVVAIGADGIEAVSLFEMYTPDVLLMDIRMEKRNGLEAASMILSKYPNAKILLLTTFADDEYIVKAISIGACGYLLKQDFECIVPALLAVEKGQRVFGADIVNRIPMLMKKESKPEFEKSGITEKEYEIITLVAEGLNNKEIAESLFLGEGTVRNYLSVILEKLSLRDRTQLAVYFYQHMQG